MRPASDTTARAYRSPAEHLDDELRHLDLLLQRVAARFERDWGATATHQGIYITREEVEQLLTRRPDDTGPDTAGGLDAEIGEHRDRIDRVVAATRAAGIDLPLRRLSERLGLSAAEAQILVACLAPELDRSYDRVYAYLQDDLTRRRPSVDLVTALIAGHHHHQWAALHLLSPQAPLLAFGVLRVVHDAASPSGSSALARLLQVAPPVVSHLLGRRELDRLLVDAGRFVAPADPAGVLDHGLAHLLQIVEHAGQRGPVIHVHGAPGAGRASLVRGVTTALATSHVEVRCPALPASPGQRAEAIHAALREAWLNGLPVVLLDADALLFPADGSTREQMLDPALARFPVLVLLTGEQPWPPGADPAGRVVHRVRVDPPGHRAREVLWRNALASSGLATGDDEHDGERAEWAELLAAQVRLNPGQVADVASEVRDTTLGRDRAVLDDWLAAARRRATHRLDGLARRIRLGRGWDDLVLDADRTTLLHEICDQVRLRETVLGGWGMADRTGVSRGLSVLFAGPPGTGKTMLAGVIARELGLELFAVDLSRVVSKYIGETEKNLAHVFAAAEFSGAVLLFDEADALFGARTEISDAHDRYANIETSYLLQRIEEYDGIAVLSTNLRQNIDEAFQRRLRFLVDFPLPDVAQRRRIWARHLGGEVPVDGVDLDLLATCLPVAGGSIRNIALAAAFLAAADGTPVGMTHLMWAARREFEKLGKLWRDPSTPDGRTATLSRRATRQGAALPGDRAALNGHARAEVAQ